MHNPTIRISIKEAELAASYVGSILECESNGAAREIAEAIERGGSPIEKSESWADDAALYLKLIRFLEQSGVDKLEHHEEENQLHDAARN